MHSSIVKQQIATSIVYSKVEQYTTSFTTRSSYWIHLSLWIILEESSAIASGRHDAVEQAYVVKETELAQNCYPPFLLDKSNEEAVMTNGKAELTSRRRHVTPFKGGCTMQSFSHILRWILISATRRCYRCNRRLIISSMKLIKWTLLLYRAPGRITIAVL